MHCIARPQNRMCPLSAWKYAVADPGGDPRVLRISPFSLPIIIVAIMAEAPLNLVAIMASVQLPLATR